MKRMRIEESFFKKEGEQGRFLKIKRTGGREEGREERRKKVKRKANLGKRGESDFHSYQIIRFKYSVFNKKSQGLQRKKQEIMAHLKEKNKSTETVL